MADTRTTQEQSQSVDVLTESTFYQMAEQTLRAIEQSLEDAFQNDDLDLDISRQGGNVVNVVFEDKSVIVINTQPPLQEIWVAAKEGGFHFKWAGQLDSPKWLDTKTGADLFAEVSRLASQQAKTKLVVRFR